ncbi:MAG: thioesterase family protein [Myxococcota bacterium]
MSDTHPPRFWHELVVRYADTDAQGHVYFANYLTFFDEGLTGYLHAVGFPPQSWLDEGVDVVCAHVESSYAGRAFFEDRLRVGVRITRWGTTSFNVSCSVQRRDATIAEGQLVQVCVDADSMETRPYPRSFREAVEAFEASG